MTDPMQSPYYQLLSTFPDQNPLGLHVIIYTKDELICAVRYSRSTSKYSISLNEFDEVKDDIMAYYDNLPWIEHADDSVYRGAKIYNDGRKRINITRHHVIFVDLSVCG